MEVDWASSDDWRPQWGRQRAAVVSPTLSSRSSVRSSSSSPPRDGVCSVHPSPRLPQVDGCARGELVERLLAACVHFRLAAETKFLAVAILDSFLHMRHVATIRDLNLIGLAALLIAAKFEEVDPEIFQIRELVYYSDLDVSATEVTKMERAVLCVLKFSIARQTAAHSLKRYKDSGLCDDVLCRFLEYLLELTLLDDLLAQQPPGRAIAVALYLARRLAEQEPPWSDTLQSLTGHAEAELRECAVQLQCLLQDAMSSTPRRSSCHSMLPARDPELWAVLQGLAAAPEAAPVSFKFAAGTCQGCKLA